MFINEKGKLFGLINIIDLGIIVLLVALVFGGAYKLKSINSMEQKDLKEVMVTVGFEEESKGLVDAINNGDILEDSVRGIEIGEVVKKDIKVHEELVVGKDGKVEYREIPGSFDGEITLKGKAIVDDDGVVVQTRPLYIGTEIRLKSNIYVFSSKVLDLQF